MNNDNDTSVDWMEELLENVSEKILSVAKFKTHKQRKAFLGEISNQIRTVVANHTNPKVVNSVRKAESAITRPNPNGKGQGFAVMTEGLSQQGDEVVGRGPTSVANHADNVPKNNQGVRSW